MALDLYQLKTFFTFGKLRSFTQTAERLYVTQSAVSHSLKKLEQSVGTKLFDRRGKAYELTDAGELLYKSCQQIFYEIEKFEDSMAGGTKQMKQKLCLGAPVEFGSTVLVQKVGEFIKRYPHIHVDFLFANNLRSPLQLDEVDLVVDCKSHHQKNLESIFLFGERYVVIASPEYMKHHDIQRPKDLERVTVLSLQREGDWWDNFLMALPGEERPHLKNIMQINHVRGLINGAITGIGVSFVPRYTVVSELEQGILNDVFGDSAMDDRFCIYIKKERRDLEKNQLLIRFLQDAFSGFDA